MFWTLTRLIRCTQRPSDLHTERLKLMMVIYSHFEGIAFSDLRLASIGVYLFKLIDWCVVAAPVLN